ncbi:Beta-lactamase [anaerobic digester metagenome]
MLLSHQAGVPAIRKPIPNGAFYDWEYMVKTLEEEAPFWEPGTRHGYHAITFGWLVGEVVKRISGKSLGKFFKDEIADTLGLDFWIGLPAEIEPRVAYMIMADPPTEKEMATPYFQAVMTPGTIPNLVTTNTGGFIDPIAFNSREARAAEIGAATGVTNARGLAGMYAPLACSGSVNGVELLDKDTVAKMSTTFSAGLDATLLAPSRFSLGFNKSIDNRKHFSGASDSMILSDAAFGHAGSGGLLGFADPVEKISFGYTMNKMGPGIMLNSRGQSLVDAVYKALGYRSNESGVWTY